MKIIYSQFVGSYSLDIKFLGLYTKGITRRIYTCADRYEAKSFADKNQGTVIGDYIVL